MSDKRNLGINRGESDVGVYTKVFAVFMQAAAACVSSQRTEFFNQRIVPCIQKPFVLNVQIKKDF